MRIAGIEFPQDFWDALNDDKLVLFAGAGVSKGKPAGLPDFRDLARAIARGTGERRKYLEPEESFLGRLKEQRGTRVHKRAARILSNIDSEPTNLHKDLLRLFKRDHKVRLVTTNFDGLFEQAVDSEDVFDTKPEVFGAPALPLGLDFTGIVHVHGAVSQPESMVLTDQDFGRAYLTEGWARRFLVDVFRTYTVLFVGYSHNDTIMNYLARALPKSDEFKRFALTDSMTAAQMRWQTLGIQTISYTKSRGHRALHSGVNGLARYARRSILEWKREIETIAQNPLPHDKESADIIEESLNDPDKTPFFANAASDPAWIEWLDERKHLSAIFGHGKLSAVDGVISGWLAGKFACQAADRLFLLIGEHNTRLHPNLWWNIGYAISSGELAPDQDILSRWVSVLLADIPANTIGGQHNLLDLGVRFAQNRLFDRVLQLFEAMTASRLELESGFSLDDRGESPIDAELKFVGETHVVWGLWKDCLEPHLCQVTRPLLGLVIRRIEERHLTLRSWNQSENWERPAIEEHPQNLSTGLSTILVDAARDTLEWLAENEGKSAPFWRDQLANSDAPLLRRLAIHLVIVQSEITPDEKIAWLLTEIDIHDPEIHHEVFRLAEQAYPHARQESKASLINAVSAFRWKDEKDPDQDKITARHHLRWFSWLHSKDSCCSLAKQALNSVSSSHPDISAPVNPDFLTYSGVSFGPRSPWTVDQLLSRSADDWREELKSFNPANSYMINRNGLLYNLAEAAQRQFDWGMELAESLARHGDWEVDLWSSLLQAWVAMELSEQEYTRVLSCISETSLAKSHAFGIANVLLALVRNQGKPYALRLLSRANESAMALWQDLDRKETGDEHDDWLHRAGEHAAGRLTDFWIDGLSLWCNAKGPASKRKNDQYRVALTTVVSDPTIPGMLGRSVLLSNFPFLLHADREWTLENLLPSFNPDSDNWEVARESLARINIDPDVADLLHKAFLEAVQWSSSEGEYVRGQFILRYIYMIAYFVEDPLNTWIPKLFNDGGEDIGEVFTSNLNEKYLWEMEEATQREWWQRWLKGYWVNRLEGVPYALTPKEIAHMLHWPAQLTAVFPEAVALAMRMGETTSEFGNLLYSLGKSNLSERFPSEIARFLLHLDNIGVQDHWWGAKDLLKDLLESSISDDIKHNLRELMAKQGIEE